MATDHGPLISIIIPVYNVSAYLDSSLQTVVSQTYQDLEIILVNDGSTDNSGELCDSWAKTDPRIRVIHQSNRGPSDARNAGLDAAAGEYIMFFDSDDFMSPDLCRVLLDAMSPDVNITACDCVHVFPGQACTFESSPETVHLSAEEAIQQLWYQTGVLPSVWGKLYRKHLFAACRFAPGIYFEDVDIIHKLYWAAGRIAYSPSRLYGYVHRKNSITTAPFSAKEFDILDIVENILIFAQDKPMLLPAAKAYATTAAFRVYLNTPRQPAYSDNIRRATDLLELHGKEVLRDKHLRRKNRYALYLFFLCRPLLFHVYQYVDRWK